MKPTERWETKVDGDLVDETMHDEGYVKSVAELRSIEWEAAVNADLVDDLLGMGKMHGSARTETQAGTTAANGFQENEKDWERLVESDLVDDIMQSRSYKESCAELKGIEWDAMVNADLVDEFMASRNFKESESERRDLEWEALVGADLVEEMVADQGFKQAEAELKGIEWDAMVNADLVDEFMASRNFRESESERRDLEWEALVGADLVEEMVADQGFKQAEAELKGIEWDAAVYGSLLEGITYSGDDMQRFARAELWSFARNLDVSSAIKKMQSELLLVSDACGRALEEPEFNTDVDFGAARPESIAVLSNKHQLMRSEVVESNWDLYPTKLIAGRGQLRLRSSPLFNSDVDFTSASSIVMDQVAYQRVTASLAAMAVTLVSEARLWQGKLLPPWGSLTDGTEVLPVYSLNKFEKPGCLCSVSG